MPCYDALCRLRYDMPSMKRRRSDELVIRLYVIDTRHAVIFLIILPLIDIII